MSRRGFTHETRVNKSVEWFTPPEIFKALNIRFDLDPCAAEGGAFVPADRYYTKSDDGLNQEWEGTVFVNPPYGADTPVWLQKLIEHGDGIALVFSRTDTRWAQEALARADVVCFISGRVKFYAGNTTDNSGTPGTGSMLLAYGSKASAALEGSGLGVLMKGAAP